MEQRCQNCEYWVKKYQKCDHLEQYSNEAEDYAATPDKVCELYEPIA